jgi:hypothetical protein
MGVLVTKLPETHPVMYPFLLESFKAPTMTNSMGTLCKCIQHIIVSHQDDAAFPLTLDFDRMVNLPKPQMLMVRLMMALNTPFNPRFPGAVVLRCLTALAPYLQYHFGQVCVEHVPTLIEFLEGHTEDSLPQPKWEDYVLKLFKEIVGGMDSEGWLVDLAEHLCQTVEWCVGQPVPKRVCMRYLGATLACIKSRDLVRLKVDFLLDKCNNNDDIERHGAAQGLGLAAKMHLDMVLEKLTAVLKRVEGAKQGGFFGIGESPDAKNAEVIRSTISLCLGFVTAYASPELMVSRVEMHVLNQLVPLMNGAKTPGLRECLIKALDLIGKALHPSRLAKPLLLRQRDELLRSLLNFLKEAQTQPSLRVLGVNACATLSNLEPSVPTELRTAMLNEVLPYFQQDEAKDGVEVTELTMTNLNNVLSSLLQLEPTLPLLSSLLQRVERWVVAPRAKERERACQAYLVLLKKFISKCTVEKIPQKENSWALLGDLLATLLPRCGDSRAVIRSTAIESVQALLYIDQVLKNPADTRPSQDILLFTELRTRMESEVQTERMAVVRDLAALLCTLVSPDMLVTLLRRLMGGLNDPDSDACLSAAHFLQGFFKTRGAELEKNVADLSGLVLPALAKMVSPPVVDNTLVAFRFLAITHFQAYIQHLLSLPLPLTPEAIKCFMMVAQTPELVVQLLNTLLSTLNDSPFSDDKPVLIVRVATCALSAVLKEDLVQASFTDYYAPLLCTLLLRLGSAFGVDAGPSTEEAVEAVQSFLVAAKETALAEACKGKQVWELVKTRDYELGVIALMEYVDVCWDVL